MQGVPTIAQFNTPIKVKELITEQNSAGDVINTGYTVLFETFAAFEAVSSKAMYLQGLENLENTFKVWIRSTKERKVLMQYVIEYETQDYVIMSLQEISEGGKSFLQLLIKVRSDKG